MSSQKTSGRNMILDASVHLLCQNVLTALSRVFVHVGTLWWTVCSEVADKKLTAVSLFKKL